MRDNPEYKKILMKYKIVQHTLVPLLTLSLCFVAIAIYMIETLSILLPISIIVVAVVVLLLYFSLKRIAAKEKALRESIYGEEIELQATNPLFQAIIDEYESQGLESFFDSIQLPNWKLVDCDDYNGTITAIFTRKSSEIIIELSDTDVSIHFDEEGDDVLITKPLTSQDFSDMKSLSEYIRLQCRTHYSAKRT